MSKNILKRNFACENGKEFLKVKIFYPKWLKLSTNYESLRTFESIEPLCWNSVSDFGLSPLHMEHGFFNKNFKGQGQKIRICQVTRTIHFFIFWPHWKTNCWAIFMKKEFLQKLLHLQLVHHSVLIQKQNSFFILYWTFFYWSWQLMVIVLFFGFVLLI